MGIVWTLRARGLAPSLGAGGSLVVAALCCLLFATALMTFRDWPGRGEPSPGGTITMSPPAGKAAGRVASGPVPAVVAASAAPVAATPGTRRDRRSAPRRAGRVPQVPANTNSPAATAPAPAPVPAPAPAPAPPAPAPAAATQPAASAPQAPPAANPQPARDPGLVERTVETGREVTKPLPPVLQEPIQPVLDTVQAVGKTVDDTVAPLLPTLP
jgi:hypothetical protein